MMTSWKEDYFGSQILTKSDGSVGTAQVLAEKKLIGIYFSAHWCPPCRGFTPVLAEFYQDAQSLDENKLEIVFVSSDEDEASFNSYFASMPWTALAFSERSLKQKLSSKFGVRGIPAFVILDGETGRILDANARSAVAGCRGKVEQVIKRWESGEAATDSPAGGCCVA